jgi:hypothetical protein
MQHKVSRRMAWLSAAAAAVVVAGLTTLGGPAAEGAANAPAASPAASGGTRIAYYDQWSIYQNAYYPKNVDALANNVDYLLYDFENVDPTNLTCFENTKASTPDPGGENDPNAGDGAGDAFADYQKSFGSDISVDGTADSYNMPIVGNFHQLQELKARHPNLKVVLSLGGWTYSKYFSDAAATDASRKKFVSSCIDMFIKGNRPRHGGRHLRRLRHRLGVPRRGRGPPRQPRQPERHRELHRAARRIPLGARRPRRQALLALGRAAGRAGQDREAADRQDRQLPRLRRRDDLRHARRLGRDRPDELPGPALQLAERPVRHHSAGHREVHDRLGGEGLHER